MSELVEAKIWKRALGGVIDLILAAFFGLLLHASAQAIAQATPGVKSIADTLISVQVDSGLFHQDKDGNTIAYDDLSNYRRYEEKLVRYYTVYLPNEVPEGQRETYDVYWYNVHILGLKDELGKYPGEAAYEPAKSLKSDLFAYAVVDGEKQYQSVGVPHPSLLNRDGVPSAEAEETLLAFYAGEEHESAYYHAITDFWGRDFFARPYRQYQVFTSVIPLMSAVFLSALLFYFTIPMIMPNGETLAMKFFHYGLVSKWGYSVTKGMIVLRQLPQILLATILAFFSLAYMVIGMGALFIISYLMMIFGKTHRGLNDLLAATLVVDVANSTFYASKAEAERAKSQKEEVLKAADEMLAEGERILEKERKEKAIFLPKRDKQEPSDNDK